MTVDTPAARTPIAAKFRVERWIFAFGIGVSILAGYIAVQQWNLARFDHRGVTPITFWTRFDRAIPLVPAAIWPYFSYYVIAMSPTFVATRWAHMVRMGVAYLSASLVAWAVWIVLPVRMVDVSIVCSGLNCSLLTALLNADGGVNVFPSLHVAHSVLAWLFYRSHRNRFTPLVAVGALAVIASTVLTRQHYLVDLPAGIATGFFGWWSADRVMRWSSDRAALHASAPSSAATSS